ncbi:MAG: hypothetical protein KGJ62_11120 [Armatimonadetes bacterium]|nr:hypothetical protein [Armatimonadota bacterium]MDE2208053.1 hypothetical protein [Armatimonadota bacterium]
MPDIPSCDDNSNHTALRPLQGAALSQARFPLGGIGTGMLSLGGRGNLTDWEILNHPGKGKTLPYSFFAILARSEGEAPVARVLERAFLPPYSAGFGLPTAQVAGLPRMSECTMEATYPEARIHFDSADLPVQVELRAFNPMVPGDARTSGMPVACFEWTVANAASKPAEVTVVFSLLNAIGWDGRTELGGRHNKLFGRNLNLWRSSPNLRGILFCSGKPPLDSPAFGTMAVATPDADVTWRLRWERAGWWDDVQSFWDGFTSSGGLLPNDLLPSPSPDGQTDVGSLGIRMRLEPGETRRARFVLAWHFPNLVNTWNGEKAVAGCRLGNWYALQWRDAWDAARDAAAGFDLHGTQVRTLARAFEDTTMPAAVVDAVSANISILRTPTVLRTADGRMNAFEGCGDLDGCCAMNCTHVWNYAQAAAWLYPELERGVRRTDFEHNTRPSGDMAFRTLLPLIGELWAFKPAADGQMGTVMKAWREFQQCGDMAFLGDIWPGVRRAMEFAWQHWDADADGVMEGEQHNTYDIEFYGPNTMTGSLYLGALRAAEEIALVLGETGFAQRCRGVFEAGSHKTSELLFNGEYFVQKGPDESADGEPRYQYGPGCLADQLLGQWFAHTIGLGYLLPKEQVRKALSSIYRHNFKRSLAGHTSVQRVYALNDEAGLLLCTWPNGGRPKYPFPYADEVWTGIEYQVAAHMLYEGLMDEGLELTAAVRDRHAGWNRNPWDECECGHHYARAMSSYSLVLAMSGCAYDAHRGSLRFAPLADREDFRTFFAAGGAWGVYWQRLRDGAWEAGLDLHAGSLQLRRLGVGVPDGPLQVTMNGNRTMLTVLQGSVQLPGS